MLGVAALVLVATGCSAGTSDEDRAAPTAAAEARQPLLSSGVRYAVAPSGWSDPTLDLYLPSDAAQPPVAVIVPDAGVDAGGADYAELAHGLAENGVVAAVVRWGVASPDLATLAGRPIEDLVAQTERTAAEVSCALGVAAAKVGADVGTPGRRLVVVGHGAGANAAAMAVMTTTDPFAGCFAAGEAPDVSAAILWDGDWLAAVAGDLLGAGASSFLGAYSPWPSVDRLVTQTYVEVGVNANRLEGSAVEVRPTSSYLTHRDPKGTITEDLEQVKALSDGTLDPVDVTRAFAVGLNDSGVQSRERELHGEGDPDTLGPRVRALITQSVVQLTRP